MSITHHQQADWQILSNKQLEQARIGDQYIQIGDQQAQNARRQFDKLQAQRIAKEYVNVQRPAQPQMPRPSGFAGMFARAKQAAKRAAGFKTQQQKQQQLNAAKGRQVMALIKRVDKSITDKVLAKVANVVPTVLSKDTKLKLKVKVATVLSNLGIIKLSNEDKLLIKLAPIYMKAKQFMADTISYISGAAGMVSGFFRGGSTKNTIKPKRTTKPKSKSKSKSKSKPKPRKIKINH